MYVFYNRKIYIYLYIFYNSLSFILPKLNRFQDIEYIICENQFYLEPREIKYILCKT